MMTDKEAALNFMPWNQKEKVVRAGYLSQESFAQCGEGEEYIK